MILKSRTLSRTSDTTETRNPCVISHLFFNLFNLFWHTDNIFCFYAEVNFWDFVRNDNSNKGRTVRLNETRFGPKKSRPQYISAKKSRHFLMQWMSVKLPDNFQMREHSWPCRFHIIRYIFFTETTLCKHRFQCNTLTHSTNEDLLNIKRKCDPEVSYPLSYVRYHWNPEPVCNESNLANLFYLYW